MTPEQHARVEDLFFRVHRALPAERSALLGAEADPKVRAEVESLIGPVPEAFLGTPVFGSEVLHAVAGTSEPDPMVGVLIGPYRVERLVGAGGMGAVYLGTRADGAFEQRVAIKVVKRGMDTDEILRRFRTERRTLANLGHPNIAVLHDGGSLPDGRPYLVMEFVDGTPINRYCAERGLSTAQRLKLFAAVCRAVQFAHQNLVIHRDLKPGNILVTAEGVPKLLDFGIAKVLSPGTDSAPVTEVEERRLTPEYASPEQVEGRAVTTASDIYSLGVILYEMLAGRSPYAFRTRSQTELQRVVGGTPPPPSTVAGDDAGGSATQRLRRELRGDLDTIVLMAMRREPERRYVSAEQLASDIERYLRGLPVIARRDTLGYRAGKFLRRHALASALAALVVLGIAAGVIAVAWQASVARRQRDEAFTARDQSEATTQFLRDMIESADPFRAGPDVRVRDLLDQAAARLDSELDDRPLVRASLRSAIGTAFLGLGDIAKAEKEIRAAYDTRLKHAGPNHHDAAEARIDMATLLYAKQDFAEAERLLRRALDVFRSIRGDHNLDIARVQNNLGAVLRASGKTDGALAALEDAIRIRREKSGARSLDLAESLNNYGNALRQAGRLADAEKAVTEALSIRTEVLGAESPLAAQSTANLAVLIHTQGDLDRAAPLYIKAMELEARGLGERHPNRGNTLNSYATLLKMKNDAAGAERYFREAVVVRAGGYPAWDMRVISSRLGLVEMLALQQKWDQAEAELKIVLDAAAAGEADPATRDRVKVWAASYYRQRGNEQRAGQVEALLGAK